MSQSWENLWTDGRTDRRMDGQTLFYRTLLAEANNETQCVPLRFLLSRLIKYAPSFILGKLYFEKASLNLGS